MTSEQDSTRGTQDDSLEERVTKLEGRMNHLERGGLADYHMHLRERDNPKLDFLTDLMIGLYIGGGVVLLALLILSLGGFL